MYIYHALINALSAHMMHINLNVILYTHAPAALAAALQLRGFQLRSLSFQEGLL